ncbi:hypothetical protein CYQ88_10135 [Hydrogenovibrio sp. SC-1]|uniref:replication-relaxation family protein n=1 Tax=Hydrogenovibrio sp. SC-1 TaxID=2065820 RepID=UPI000C7D7D80|nr:replication-relaxation family protein [Hydrogenovibrio sp. SC-1]PLA73614.1 hypothetical protein CYQ88_10135 [Hydrogenovibrio sp. SC-1]
MSIKLYEAFCIYNLHNPVSELSHLEKGYLRKLAILDWLYRFRYSSIPALVKVAGDSKGKTASQIQKLLNRMEKRNEIRKFPLITGFTKYGYVLTESGFLTLQQSQPDRTFTQRVFKESHKLTASNFVHNLAIQEQIIDFIHSDKHKIGFANEWEVRRHFKSQNFNGKTFDAICEKTLKANYENERVVTIGIEVELSQKNTARLRSALKTADSMIQDGEVDYVFYLVPTAGFKRSIDRQLKSLNKSNDINNANLFQVIVSGVLEQIIRGKRA